MKQISTYMRNVPQSVKATMSPTARNQKEGNTQFSFAVASKVAKADFSPNKTVTTRKETSPAAAIDKPFHFVHRGIEIYNEALDTAKDPPQQENHQFLAFPSMAKLYALFILRRIIPQTASELQLLINMLTINPRLRCRDAVSDNEMSANKEREQGNNALLASHDFSALEGVSAQQFRSGRDCIVVKCSCI